MDLKVAVLVILGVLLVCKIVYISRLRARKKQSNLASSQQREKAACEKSKGESKPSTHME